MPKKNSQNGAFNHQYAEALREYLHEGGEAALVRAYELGRQSLIDGRGVLSMVALHHEAMAQLLSDPDEAIAIGADPLMRAGMFFTESMSPFEMTHRAFAEANAALHHVNQSLEEELKRIAHALHDEAGQLLAAVHLTLDQVESELGPHPPAGLSVVKQHLDDVYMQLRHLSHELRPTVLDDLGLVPAIEFLSQGMAKRSGLRVMVQSKPSPRLPLPIETALYRVVQEALTNIHKHARAKSVHIRVRISEKAVKCAIVDDGVGFNPDGGKERNLDRGLGLLGMREKVQKLGGVLKIESAPGQGTKLEISVPRREKHANTGISSGRSSTGSTRVARSAGA